MTNELTQEQNQYLRERGFCAVEGRPTRSELFPYITLRELQEFGEESEMTYHQARYVSEGTSGFAHPLAMPMGELVNLIERTVAENMQFEGISFQTRPGQQIKVFVIDPVWKEVADALTAKYKPQKQNTVPEDYK